MSKDKRAEILSYLELLDPSHHKMFRRFYCSHDMDCSLEKAVAYVPESALDRALMQAYTTADRLTKPVGEDGQWRLGPEPGVVWPQGTGKG